EFCLDCLPPELPIALASWRTRRPQPAAKRTHAFDREAVLGFLQRLGEPDSPQKVQFRFVLALLLWRKKVLKFDGSQPDGAGELWNFRLPVSGEKYAVERPDLDEEEIESLSAQLEQLLAGDTAEGELALSETGSVDA